MRSWILEFVLPLLLIPLAIGLFFYAFTKGALILRQLRHQARSPSSHVYPLYSTLWLIRLVDFQPVISAILLFQYSRLVSSITTELQQMSLRGQDVLITSCAFGDVVPRVVQVSLASGARKVRIVDLIENELVHARSKLAQPGGQVDCFQGDATAMSLPDASVTANVLFFLLHELEPEMKRKALSEAARVLTPGGKLLLAEFHRPEVWALRALGWLYFKCFEPFGLALWDVQDPVLQLDAIDGIHCERRTALFGNFQVIVATKAAAA
ncbi:MAG: methyltransferase domain-containing protein [Burkholderiales bacterium]|nr:methyltransferase domain-containing protein [Burkholderiales bacterium]MDE2393810.1 methyltransferase domain-containing protein [Burkholderiales bacterium]MDE2456560.1 methyltransferase domain-containing protein [Burkholderiales bacterium]